MVEWAVTLIYFVLAVLATVLSAHHQVRLVGFALITAWFVSVAGALAAPFPERPVVEVLTQVVIAWASTQAWARGQGSPVRLILNLALADCGFAAAICLWRSADRTTVELFDLVTNLIFAAQCFCVGLPGARDVVAGWVRDVHARRSMDTDRPDHDWLIGQLDRID